MKNEFIKYAGNNHLPYIDKNLPLYLSEDGRIWLKTKIISYSGPRPIEDNPYLIKKAFN